jgi:hypothetical protein
VGRSIAERRNEILKLDIFDYDRFKLHNGYRLGAFNIFACIATMPEINLLGTRNRLLRKLTRDGILAYKKKSFFVEKRTEESKFNSDVFTYKDLYLSGYWQNENYFLSIRELLLEELTLKEPIGTVASTYYESIKKTNSVAVHIRRGDYINADWTIGVDYYKKAYELMKSKVDNPSFFVFSDDISWCKENLCFLDNPRFVEGTNSELDDFELMRVAKHNIVANSSYSWWAAWLNSNDDKIVIAPKIWFQNRRDFSPQPESWLTV